MGIKSKLSIPFARFVANSVHKNAERAIELQQKQFRSLLQKAAPTAFGKDHHFKDVNSPDEFRQAVALADYEDLRPYVERVIAGEANVLWPGLPKYFCKTSGTTSGVKYIPLTEDSMPNHIRSARNALLCYIAETGQADFVDGKMIFLQGSPELHHLPSGIPYGRLSGIVAHHVPGYLQKNRLPSWQTNVIDDWEQKLDAIVGETQHQPMSLISGIPSWVQMYFERLLERSGAKDIQTLFPKFRLMVYGGVNFDPYRARFHELIGAHVPTLETYPASEGFIAYQDSVEHEGLLLTFNDGIWYEFIPADQFFDANPPRLSLEEVKVGVNYAIVLNTNAGLWGYVIGDTVRFVSLSPPRIKVTGRIKHFTSAFGEHVIAEEVEKAMTAATAHFGFSISEFHVAPVVTPEEGLPYHEWLVEFEQQPADIHAVEAFIDREMCRQNTYYNDLISGSVLRTCIIRPLPIGAFHEMMRSRGKLGGQNKVPRLANDREVANLLIEARSV